uniref:phosphopantetheine-binding protein n=1 Tax=Cohnella faecalis TaxID=2315694 RepID=UPI001313E5AA|nr:phosphopantetheine-binding protein [Cohnella faecalis]
MYEAPRNALEETLANIWQGVLGVSAIGITDNFFELGGDSIKAIQISARLHAHHLKMEIKDLFQHPTIGKLSSCLRPVGRTIDQGLVEGEVELTPIQRWFFEQTSRTGRTVKKTGSYAVVFESELTYAELNDGESLREC